MIRNYEYLYALRAEYSRRVNIQVISETGHTVHDVKCKNVVTNWDFLWYIQSKAFFGIQSLWCRMYNCGFRVKVLQFKGRAPGLGS